MQRKEKGQVMVLFVAGLTALIGMSAVGIDVGYLYTVRHELQRSSDAGALAGASAFFDGPWSDPGIRALASTRAKDFSAKDTVAGKALNAPQEVTVAFPSPQRVRVDASRTVNLFFSRMFLGPTRTVTAHSVAETSAVGKNVKGLKPWGIPFPWEDTNGNDLYDAGETVHRDCPPELAAQAAMSPQMQGTSGIDWPWPIGGGVAFACIKPPPPPEPSSDYFCPGTRVILKIGTPQNSPKNPSGIPSLQQESGHFFALALDGKGGSVYRDTIVNGGQTPYSVGDAITLEPGNNVGPTVQGTRDLMDADSGSAWNSAKNLPESDLYRIDDGSWMNSPRVIRIPVYDPEIALHNGRKEMVVASFAGFWVESIQTQGTVIGRFIPNRAFGNLGPNAGPATGPVLKVLRLVE
jgi:Flp pilus assembly protein TadG